MKKKKRSAYNPELELSYMGSNGTENSLRALHKIKFNFYVPPAVAKSYSSTWD